MAEYIDREAIYRKACRGCTRHGDEIGICYLEEPCEALQAEFASAPAADVAPVRHGRWVDWPVGQGMDIWHKCSLCGDGEELISNFCPNCGAKMDGKGTEE